LMAIQREGKKSLSFRGKGEEQGNQSGIFTGNSDHVKTAEREIPVPEARNNFCCRKRRVVGVALKGREEEKGFNPHNPALSNLIRKKGGGRGLILLIAGGRGDSASVN